MANEFVKIDRVVSGGQTGADRAALDAAMAVGVPVGGWCPRGRRAEDGIIDERYPLTETPGAAVEQRTSWNVRDSDATLVLVLRDVDAGTAFTIEEAERFGRPVQRVEVPAGAAAVGRVRTWIDDHDVAVLNVAGPRESNAPGLYEAARRFLLRLFEALG